MNLGVETIIILSWLTLLTGILAFAIVKAVRSYFNYLSFMEDIKVANAYLDYGMKINEEWENKLILDEKELNSKLEEFKNRVSEYHKRERALTQRELNFNKTQKTVKKDQKQA